MVSYEKEVYKKLKKGIPPKEIFVHLDNVFRAIDLTNDLNLFDIKPLKGDRKRKTYRLRKGKYRALFYIEDGGIFVFRIDKREDVYKWVFYQYVLVKRKTKF